MEALGGTGLFECVLISLCFMTGPLIIFKISWEPQSCGIFTKEGDIAEEP